MAHLIKSLLAGAAVLGLSATGALADVSVSFDEGAPKDRFTFTNTGSCTIENAALTLDLSGSSSGLIFDVTNKGAGVEVFQPLEMTDGVGLLQSTPKVKDGDNKVVFQINELPAGQKISFTIDVDDTTGGREITVSGSEIAGAKIMLSKGGKSSAASFNARAKATVALKECTI